MSILTSSYECNDHYNCKLSQSKYNYNRDPKGDIIYIISLIIGLNQQKEEATMAYETVFLGEIATIVSGYPFKGSPKYSADSDVYLATYKDVKFSKTMYLKIDDLKPIKFCGTTTMLVPGDVLLSNRLKYCLAIMPEFRETKIIAREFLTIIRAHKKYALPEFIYMKLNENRAEELLLSRASGTKMKFLRVETLKNVKLRIPEIETQSKIIEIYKNIEKLKIAYNLKLDNIIKVQNGLSTSFIEGFELEKRELEKALLVFQNLDPPIATLTSAVRKKLKGVNL